jgi:hypothetical protein
MVFILDDDRNGGVLINNVEQIGIFFHYSSLTGNLVCDIGEIIIEWNA